MTCVIALIDGNKVYLGGDGAASEDKTALIVTGKQIGRASCRERV